jgi:hypothetical protein
LTEAELQSNVIELARVLKWRVAHFRNVRVQLKHGTRYMLPVAADGVGFPDLVMVKRDRTLFVELKAEKGVVSREQHDWIDALTGSRNREVYVWRPQNWTSGEIETILR